LNLKTLDLTNTPDLVARILAGAVFAGDFLALRDLVNPKSKLRMAFQRQASKLIERELPRVLLDAEVLQEAEREQYDRILDSIRQRHGEQITSSPFEPPQEVVEELAERALAKGSFASTSDALEYLGVRNKRVGELVASAIRHLKSKEDAPASDPAAGYGSPAEEIWLAVKIKNPLEPLFQKRAVDFHSSGRQTRDQFYQFLVAGNVREALDFSIKYLLGDQDTFESVRSALAGDEDRRTFLRDLARVLSGGDEEFAVFVSRYRSSVEALRAGSEKKPDADQVRRVQSALAGGETYDEDGIGLLRHLATTHPVSALVCRMIAVPRKGPHLIPIVFEGNTALDVLGLG
jgi:hypothetical protein